MGTNKRRRLRQSMNRPAYSRHAAKSSMNEEVSERLSRQFRSMVIYSPQASASSSPTRASASPSPIRASNPRTSQTLNRNRQKSCPKIKKNVAKGILSGSMKLAAKLEDPNTLLNCLDGPMRRWNRSGFSFPNAIGLVMRMAEHLVQNEIHLTLEDIDNRNIERFPYLDKVKEFLDKRGVVRDEDEARIRPTFLLYEDLDKRTRDRLNNSIKHWCALFYLFSDVEIPHFDLTMCH